MTNTDVPFLQLVKITKSYGNLIANNNIDLTVNKGEVLALLGENGSGKTTLMNVIYGLHTPDSGTIKVNGRTVKINSPKEALQHKIGMVHQHFMLIPNLDVTENIILGLEQNKLFLNKKEAEIRIRELGKLYGLEIDPRAKIEDLSVGMQQKVEILKALFRGVELLILDEPTAVLTPLEVKDFFVILQKLADNGLSSIFISHKLEEVLQISKRIVVLNRGKVVGEIATEKATRQMLAEMMVGRKVELSAKREPQSPGAAVLSIRDLCKNNEKGVRVLNGISFDIHEGEILGIAGVDGNGQQELIDVLTGMSKADSGTFSIEGNTMINRSPREIISMGVSCVPSDRQKTGAVMDISIKENYIIKNSDQKPFANHGILNKRTIDEKAKAAIRKYDIRTESADSAFRSLSGGNQQKVILAREIDSDPKLLIVCYPTRGLDIGATEYVHECILEQRKNGSAILLVSAELEEIISLSDRIAVFFRGEIMGMIDNSGIIDINEIGRMMLGERKNSLNE